MSVILDNAHEHTCCASSLPLADHRRDGHARLRPQRGRLRGARRAARGRWVPPGRGPGRRRDRGGEHLRVRGGRQEGLGGHAARRRRPQGLRSGRPAPRRRWSRSGAWPSGTAPSSPRRFPRRTPCSASTTIPTSPAGCARSSPARRSTRTRRRTGASCSRSRRPTGARPRCSSPVTASVAGSTPDRWPRSSSRRGCDRRCTFCAIPTFRGSFVSRRPSDVLAEARWLADQGARELFLVSENSTSYGKDLGDLRLLETMLPELAAVDGVERVRVSYLQPAETRPGLVTAIATHAGGGGVLRPLLPARLQPGAAADAQVRRLRGVPRPARPGQGPGSRGGRALQLHRRVPGRDRAGPGDPL